MLVSPGKIKANRIFRNRTFNFETVKRTRGNFVIIGSRSRSDLEMTVASKLFKPQQLYSAFTPRLFKPLNLKLVRQNQKEIYGLMKKNTGGRIKITKPMFNSYNGLNIAYDISAEFNGTAEILEGRKQAIMLQKALIETFENIVSTKISEANYEKNYIIFPLATFIPDFKRMVKTDISVTDPLILFLKSIAKGYMTKSAFTKVDAIFFYNPNAQALIKVDINDPEIEKDFEMLLQRIVRLNNFNNDSDPDLLDDSEVDSSEEPTDPEDIIENTKEKIKEVIFKKVAKSIKAGKLDDFEAATKEEQDIMLSIDKKVDAYLENPENVDKPFSDLVTQIENDNEIKLKSLKYVEVKRVSDQKLTQLSKNLERELEVMDDIEGLYTEDDEIEADKFEVAGIDEKILESKLSSMDEEYNKKQFMKDATNILSSFSNSSYLPMTLHDFKLEDSSDDFKKVNTLRVAFKTDEGKILRFSLDIPKIVDKRYFYLGGNKKMMTKQLIRLPIVKTKSDRVEITTNFNKVTVERTNGKLSRKNAYLLKMMEEYKNHPTISIEFGQNGIINSDYTNDFEYEELADSISTITSPSYKLIFNRRDMAEEINLSDLPEEYIKDAMTPFGINLLNGGIIYIKDNIIYESSVANEVIREEKISETMFDFIRSTVFGRASANLPKIGKSFIYTRMSIFGTSYPIFAVVGLVNGMTDILKRYNVEHIISEKKIENNGDFVEVKFQDKFLYYKDTVKNTLLLNVLYMMNTEDYDIMEFDLDKPYMDFFVDKLGQPMFIKNTLKTNFSVLLDPITIDVLKDLKLPTNIIDLLLLANTMLISNSYRPQNDLRNYRIRGNEIVNARMYKIIADAYLGYQRNKLNGRNLEVLDIPQNKLISTLLKDPNVNDHSTLNPVLEMENIASISPKGFSGINLTDAYTLEVRAYDPTMVGFVAANATPYNSNAGITRSLVYNPKITSLRGYVTDVDFDKLDPTNILSPSELLASFTSTGADPARQAMQVAQTKHTMPVEKTHKQLIGSGINKTMAFMISDDFAFKAKRDGIVEKIDLETKLAILLYSDGSKDAIDLSEVFVKNSNSGFYIKQQFKMMYTEGENFKKNDVIAYNPSFFSGKGKDVDYQPGTLAKVAIAAGDFAYEDSTIISDTLSVKAASRVTMMKHIALGPNTIIHKIAEVGQEVLTGETLLEFTTSFDDPAASEFLTNLALTMGGEYADIVGNEIITSKYTGTVANIKVYYNMPFEELSPSLQKLIQDYRAKVEKRRTAIKGIPISNFSIPAVEMQESGKVGTEEYEGAMIEFGIEYYDEMAEGDKLTYSTALKGVISKRLTNDESPLSEYRDKEIIEAVLTPTGIISRMTSDIYSMLYGNKVLVELGKQIKEIMNNER
jgi:hypothetical protein